MQPIEQFSTNELLIELSNRFDHFIFAGRIDKTGTTTSRQRFYKGDYDICVGMIQGGAYKAIEDCWGINSKNVINYDEAT